VHVGLPGLTSPTRLLRFGLRCGVGASLKVLRQQTGGVLKLATSPVHHPDATLVGLAAAAAADPASLLRSVHFFPFGALRATAEWASDIRDGRFALDDRARLQITA
jgi:methylenetetrahydrofolate reductase (NADPH)